MDQIEIPQKLLDKLISHAKRQNLSLNKLITDLLERELENLELRKCSICKNMVETQNVIQCNECNEWICCGYVEAKEIRYSYTRSGTTAYSDSEKLRIFCYNCLINFHDEGYKCEHPSKLTYDHEFLDDFLVENNIPPKNKA